MAVLAASTTKANRGECNGRSITASLNFGADASATSQRNGMYWLLLRIQPVPGIQQLLHAARDACDPCRWQPCNHSLFKLKANAGSESDSAFCSPMSAAGRRLTLTIWPTRQ